jgi:hypothetical protein
MLSCASGCGCCRTPFTAADRRAGYRYDISILQAEFSTTQVLDRPEQGRLFFEQLIRENLDLGHPEEIQLMFIAVHRSCQQARIGVLRPQRTVTPCERGKIIPFPDN